MPILDDDVHEKGGNAERFYLDLSNESDAVIEGSTSSAVTITDDDAAPAYSIDPVTVDEGDGTMTVTVAATAVSDTSVTFSYVDGTIDGTATRGDDYGDFLSGGGMPAITLAAGATSSTFAIAIVDDTDLEDDETIVMTWSSAAPPGTINFTGTIAGRDATGKPAITGVPQVGQTLTAAEGDMADGDTRPASFPDDYDFQWVRTNADDTNPVDIAGATSSTYAPVAADAGKKLRVKVGYTDGGGAEERLESEGTATVVAAPEVCATGRPDADWCAEMTVGHAVVSPCRRVWIR